MSPNVMCPLQIARIVNAPEGSYSNALANARASVLNCPESHSQTNACEQIGSVILSEAKDLLSRSKRFPEQIPRRSAPRDDRKGSSDDRKGVVPEGLVHAICSVGVSGRVAGGRAGRRNETVLPMTSVLRRILWWPRPCVVTRQAPGHDAAMARPSPKGTFASRRSWKISSGPGAEGAGSTTRSFSHATPCRAASRIFIESQTGPGIRQMLAKRPAYFSGSESGARRTAARTLRPLRIASTQAAAPREWPIKPTTFPESSATARTAPIKSETEQRLPSEAP